MPDGSEQERITDSSFEIISSKETPIPQVLKKSALRRLCQMGDLTRYAKAAGIKKVQSAVKLLKNGKSITEVAFHTELPQETVAELAQSISTEVK